MSALEIQRAIELLKPIYILVSRATEQARGKRYYLANREKVLAQQRKRIAERPPVEPTAPIPPSARVRCYPCAREVAEGRFPRHLLTQSHLGNVVRMNRKNLKTANKKI
jgi:hypothetical protein